VQINRCFDDAVANGFGYGQTLHQRFGCHC
jgi:hypothetical protein